MSIRARQVLVALVCMALTLPVGAQTNVTLYLNWAPGPEHAPLFFAQSSGLYLQSGVRLNIVPASGSGNALRLATKEPGSMAVADMQTVLSMRSKGSDVVAVMSLFSSTPHTFYWLKSSGIQTLRDFVGKRVGAEAKDPARRLWRSLARRAGIDPDAIIWVDVENNDKVEALREGKIDIVVNAFPDSVHLYPEAFGKDLAQLSWRDAGLSIYGIALVAPSVLVHDNAQAVAVIVQATQRAVASCLRDAKPCIDALVTAYPHLKREVEMSNWYGIKGLLNAGEPGRASAGAFETSRLAKDYEVTREASGAPGNFDPLSAADNRFVGKAIAR